MVATNYSYITSNEDLAAACHLLATFESVALDTEFARFKTYYQHPGLVQIASPDQVYLIDPLTIDGWEPLKTLLRAPNVTKIVHACGEDLELLQHWLGVVPTPLFDTQVAAAYADIGLSIGLKAMLQTLLGIEISKEETRSDWLQRPLTEAQCNYAAIDVLHLHRCQSLLLDAMERRQQAWSSATEPVPALRDWFYHDMQVLSEPQANMRVGDAYKKVKSAHRLRGTALYRLKQLAAWRESTARKMDRPKSFLIKDPCLLAIAEKNPSTAQALGQIPDLHPGSIRRYGKAIISVLDEASTTALAAGGDSLTHAVTTGSEFASKPSAHTSSAAMDPMPSHGVIPQVDKLPAPLPQPYSRREQKQFKGLQSLIKEVAQGYGILPQLLARKCDLVDVFESARAGDQYSSPSAWKGWRHEVLHDRVCAYLATLEFIDESNPSLTAGT